MDYDSAMEVLIVGAGAMGRWFGEILDANIAFTDVDPETATRAAAAIDGVAVELDDPGQFDVVCIAVPIPAVVDAITNHVDNASDALLDLSGVMTEPVRVMADRAPDHERISLHPLFAPENAPGRIAAVPDRPGPVTDAILDTLAHTGNTVFETTPEEHDRAMKTVQARTHAAVLAFALAAEEVPDEFGTPVFDGLTDIAAAMLDGTPRVYADIQTAFDGADDVATAARAIADADRETFERLYRDATE